ncbi:MAG: hypothetical protein KDH19_01325 [Geminicoccaceae bacterium]|nr:hypothetical protein [Geminicoccaceae bacterium]
MSMLAGTSRLFALLLVLTAPGCAVLPDGRPAPVSAETQLIAICATLAGVYGELTRAIDWDRLSAGEVEQVKYLKSIGDEACRTGGGDPIQVLDRAREALSLLEEIERRNRPAYADRYPRRVFEETAP